MLVTVEVEVDADDVLESLDDADLLRHGLERIGPSEAPDRTWAEVGGCIRRGDFNRAESLINDLATRQGFYLPPFAMARVA